MEQVAPASDLERRKKVRVRLRPDLTITPQKYEGRTYYIVKDPVSLRYYRFKDQEHFLLQLMDGTHTLDDAQKQFEQRYRPERLTLEDLEGFAQQLLTVGLAHNEAGQAGQALYDRRKKRLRREWFAYFTNILYIKLPIFDPDKLLNWILPWLRWIFTPWFFALSLGLMLGALMLIATHFEAFHDKLPSYHEFFSFKTVIYLWIALGVVKVIHEFGHGLSCKHFGGEVHEMGALFLCLSPCLYCNVSDAWTLPSKWHRLIISFAGIYVELVIAAISTFVWWNTPSHPFINNLSMSLMVVCSVSTVVFNGNPLMRFDGYYMLADWLEIPNLRERCNRYLKNISLEFFLGVEVPREQYMALWRRVLFVVYAVVSYIYRWVVTFSILWFLSRFLEPYKLKAVSTLLAMAAAGSMVGWPLWNLGKNLNKRGRLPDMKTERVRLTTIAAVVLVLAVFLLPLPISRVRQLGLVELRPESVERLFVPPPGGILMKLHVHNGEEVRKNQVLAEFRNLDLENDLEETRNQVRIQDVRLRSLYDQAAAAAGDQVERSKIEREMARTEGERTLYAERVPLLEKQKKDLEQLRSPRTGVVIGLPHIDEIGKSWEVEQEKPFCSIGEPGPSRVAVPVDAGTVENVEVRNGDFAEEGDLLAVFRQGEQRMELRAPRSGVVRGLARQARVGQAWAAPRDKDQTFCILEPRRLRVLLPVPPADYRLLQQDLEKSPNLEVTILVQGLGDISWRGRVGTLPQAEAKSVPPALTAKFGGPLAVKPGANPNVQAPQSQQYLVPIDFLDADQTICPGTLAQVKVHCRWRTCAWWVWRTVSSAFDIGLI